MNYSYQGEKGVILNGNTVSYKDQELTFLAQSESDFVGQYMLLVGDEYQTLNYVVYADFDSTKIACAQDARERFALLSFQFVGTARVWFGEADGANAVCNLRDMPEFVMQSSSPRDYTGNMLLRTSKRCDYCGIVVGFTGLVSEGL